MSIFTDRLRVMLAISLAALLVGCATTPVAYTKGTFDRPKKILINLPSDPRNWREDWRNAFIGQGYEVVFRDEVPGLPDQGSKGELPFEFHLAYRGTWDLVWYVRTVDVSVTDLSTGQVVGNYSEENLFAHPSVMSVVAKIEKDFLATLWKQD